MGQEISKERTHRLVGRVRFLRLGGHLTRLTTEATGRLITSKLGELATSSESQSDAQARLKKMRATRKRFQRLLKPGPSAVEHGDLLYDEWGLPK